MQAWAELFIFIIAQLNTNVNIISWIVPNAQNTAFSSTLLVTYHLPINIHTFSFCFIQLIQDMIYICQNNPDSPFI